MNSNPNDFPFPPPQMGYTTVPVPFQNQTEDLHNKLLQAEATTKAQMQEIQRLKSNLFSTEMELAQERSMKPFNPGRFCHDGNFHSYCDNRRRMIAIGYLEIISVTFVQNEKSTEIDFLLIEYAVNESDKRHTVIPRNDLIKLKLYQHFPEFQIPIKFNMRIVNELIKMLIQQHTASGLLTIPSKPGWSFNDDSATFICADNFEASILEKYIPEAVRNYHLHSDKHTVSEIKDYVLKNISICPESAILIGYRTSGLMSTIFQQKFGIAWKQALIVEGTHPQTAETAIGFLKNYNRPSMGTSALDSTISEMKTFFSSIKDGTIIFRRTYLHQERRQSE